MLRFSQNRLFKSPGQNISKTAFPNAMKLSGFDSCIMNYVFSGVVFWPKVKFFINIAMKLEKILFFFNVILNQKYAESEIIRQKSIPLKT